MNDNHSMTVIEIVGATGAGKTQIAKLFADRAMKKKSIVYLSDYYLYRREKQFQKKYDNCIKQAKSIKAEVVILCIYPDEHEPQKLQIRASDGYCRPMPFNTIYSLLCDGDDEDEIAAYQVRDRILSAPSKCSECEFFQLKKKTKASYRCLVSAIDIFKYSDRPSSGKCPLVDGGIFSWID